MERGYNNLGMLQEEDGEEEVWEDRSNQGRLASSYLDDEDESSQEEGQDTSDEDGEDGENGTEEPNKFDNLCDGVVNATALVNAALRELLEFKDDLLRHTLPPSVLVKLALVTSRVYRSVSDLQMPSNELIRMVRVYSTPWEEKSTALKKLHQDYESKQRQLNIAIKRLQLVDAHSKRIAREKRLMNWEKLFSKLTSAKGHGRRWKFLIESIKEKAKLGLEHVDEYARALEESSEEEEQEEEDLGVASRLSGKQGTEVGMDDTATEAPTEVSATPAERAESDDDESKEKESTVEGSETDSGAQSEVGGHSEVDQSEAGGQSGAVGSEKIGPEVTVTMTGDSDQSSDYSRSGSAKRVRFEDAPTPVISEVPSTSEQNTWTGEEVYDRKLYVRVFAPQGMKQQQLTCVISLGKQVHKTGVLDPQVDAQEEESNTQPESGEQKAFDKANSKDGKKKDEVKETHGEPYFEEYLFEVPAEVPAGVWSPKPPKTEEFRVAISSGPAKEMVAMGTISFDEVKSKDLPTIDLPTPKGDEPRLLVDVDVSDLTDTDTDQSTDREAELKSSTPTLLSLYPLTGSGKGPCGELPLLFYWGRTLQPSSFNRQTATQGVTELVYELTGIDLDVTTKEDLNKEYQDRALSAIPFTPEPEQETITREKYDQMMEQHKEELVMLQEQYEARLQGLMENLRQMPSPPPSGHNGPTQRSASAGSRAHTTQNMDSPSPIQPLTKPVEKPQLKPRPPSSPSSRKNFRVGRPLPKWGDSLPTDFLTRLEKYEAESLKHRQVLSDRLWRDVSKDIEMKLAGQHKLSNKESEDVLQDVSLPALFMPFKTGNVFNPRAHQYFHPKGSIHARLTQPPSVFQLPPLPQDKLAVVNLFNLSGNFAESPSWLMERYIDQQRPTPQGPPPSTPAFIGTHTTSCNTHFPAMVQEATVSGQSNLPVSATSRPPGGSPS